jgi:hypothetical protein
MNDGMGWRNFVAVVLYLLCEEVFCASWVSKCVAWCFPHDCSEMIRSQSHNNTYWIFDISMFIFAVPVLPWISISK